MDSITIRNGDTDEFVPIEKLKQIYLIFKKFLEITTDGFIAIDENNNILEISSSYSKWLGVSREQAEKMRIDEIIPNTGLPQVLVTGRNEYDVPHFFVEGSLAGSVTVCTRCPVIVDGKSVFGVGHVRYLEKSTEIYRTFERIFRELEYYKAEFRKRNRGEFYFDQVIGDSSTFSLLKTRAKRAAQLELSVLLTGETGTGKEVFAHAIHNESSRAGQPFICVNCAAIPKELLESELFGYEGGAFSGANKKGKPGKIELAHGGTLFLDEIGDMPLAMQAKILRVLQDSFVERLGSIRPFKVDIRIIAASNSDLEKKISQGEFRSDLFFRLNAVHLHLEPLRDRPDDIVLLAAHHLNKLNDKYRTGKIFAEGTLHVLQHYDWPGNVRELLNVVEQAYGFSDSDYIESQSLPLRLQLARSRAEVPAVETRENLASAMRGVEQAFIRSVIDKHQGHFGKAAEELGIHRGTLYRKIKTGFAEGEGCSARKRSAEAHPRRRHRRG